MKSFLSFTRAVVVILYFTALSSSCNKEQIHSNPSVEDTGLNQIQPRTLPNQKTFAYSINSDKWIDYPYIGHDGNTTENRMFFQPERPLLDLAYYKDAKSIKSVFVKSRYGELFTAPRWISVGPNDSGYVYAIGNTGTPNQFTLWWIQKPPYTEQPNADSVFITLQY